MYPWQQATPTSGGAASTDMLTGNTVNGREVESLRIADDKKNLLPS